MRPLNIFKTTLFAALAAAPLIAMTAESASAQKVASNQVASPATKTKSGNQWAFITWKAFGVKSATELNGVNFCAATGTTSANDANEFFKKNGLTATQVSVDNDRAAIKKYQQYECDALVVANRVANATINSLKPVGDHVVLPEKFGTAPTPKPKPAAARTPTPPKAPVAARTPLPPKPPATVKKQPKPKPKQTVRKKRCSAVRYGFSRGNTCGCAGGRVFNGNRCVRRRWYR